MTARLWLLLGLLVPALAWGNAEPPGATTSPFVRVQGTRFVVGQHPFYFVGANLHVMHAPDARQRAEETIAAAAADGLRVGRVWALGEGLADAPDWKRRGFLFRAGPSGWQSEAFEQLDRVLVAAAKHGLRLVIVLSNQWADYGGIPMYLRWAGQRDVEAYGYADRFFSDPRAKAWFVEHLRRVVGRVNSLTGVPYRDDPTIMTWELQNELRGTPEAAAARRRWFVEMSEEVRRLDPNHLVVPGLIGYDLQTEREQWIAMNELPQVSYCDQHTYPQNHLRSRGIANLRRFIDDRVQLAHHVIGKPIVFGEFGFSIRDNAPAVRARWHERFLQRVFFDGGNGAMVWIYQPKLGWDRPYGVLIDQTRDEPLRRVLSAQARWLSKRPALEGRNRRLGPQHGRVPLAPTHALMRQRGARSTRWSQAPGQRAWQLQIPVDSFSSAWFEEAGSWAGGVLVHAYGRRTGWFEYEFSGPPVAATSLWISARLSSEYPGSAAPPTGYSRVVVRLDGVDVAQLRVPPDDGRGRWFDLRVDEHLIGPRLRGGRHRLRFAVEQGAEANGVALYGREAPLNREPVGRVGPIQILALPKGPPGEAQLAERDPPAVPAAPFDGRW